MQSFNVGILGATGAVGQKFIRLLQDHPWFKIAVLGASERSAGKPYRKAAHWIEEIDLPAEVADIPVQSCDPEYFKGVDFVFSGLDSSVAGGIEKAFAESGIPVISNAKNYRMHEQVPLLVPEVNPDHIHLIKKQTFTEDGSGWIITNPNCVSIPLATSLRPLHDAFGIKSVILTSMQAISGAGYPGVASLDILCNVVPYIGGEEPKIHTEPLKVLGQIKNSAIEPADIPIQSTAVRIPTINGHLLSVAASFNDPPKSIEAVKKAYHTWKNPVAELGLPSAPKQAIRVYEEDHYPQPRLHADQESGMQTAVGRIREANVLDIAYVTMAHNTVRGAAGGAILNAELLIQKEYLE